MKLANKKRNKQDIYSKEQEKKKKKNVPNHNDNFLFIHTRHSNWSLSRFTTGVTPYKLAMWEPIV